MSSPLAASVRPATRQDVGVLVQLMGDFYAESSHSLDTGRAETAFVKLLTRPALGGVWVAFLDDAAAGDVVLTLRYSMDHGALCGHIEDLFVRPLYRRRHVARRLLSELIAECRRQQCATIRVEVDSLGAPAIALYRSVGLEEFRDGRLSLHGTIGASVA
jgi:ribosomal protein S18 acetylase RimI-like enzyme